MIVDLNINDQLMDVVRKCNENFRTLSMKQDSDAKSTIKQNEDVDETVANLNLSIDDVRKDLSSSLALATETLETRILNAEQRISNLESSTGTSNTNLSNRVSTLETKASTLETNVSSLTTKYNSLNTDLTNFKNQPLKFLGTSTASESLSLSFTVPKGNHQFMIIEKFLSGTTVGPPVIVLVSTREHATSGNTAKYTELGADGGTYSISSIEYATGLGPNNTVNLVLHYPGVRWCTASLFQVI